MMTERERRIVEAIARGVRTSRELARLFDIKPQRMAVMLRALSDEGHIEQGPAQDRDDVVGRPCIRWRVPKPKAVVLCRTEGSTF